VQQAAGQEQKEGRGGVKTEIQQLRRAQSNMILGGLLEALALEMGSMSLRIHAVGMVFHAETADGEELMGAFAFDKDGDWLRAPHTAHLLSDGIHRVLEDHLFGENGPGESEPPSGEYST